MNLLAIIPARGGSKRIPGKNIRPFAGKPIIGWSIEAALRSGVFTKVVVSTDCPDIAEVARSFGAEVPFLRAAELSGDTAPFMPVIRDAILRTEAQGDLVDGAFAIYATVPFLTSDRIREGAKLLETRRDADFVLTVTDFDYPVQYAMTADAEGRLSFVWPEFAMMRTQDVSRNFHDAGQYIGGTRAAIMAHDLVTRGFCLPVHVPRDEAQDIDTEDEWSFSERLFQLRHPPSSKSA